jgi:hypothetical protein
MPDQSESKMLKRISSSTQAKLEQVLFGVPAEQ